MIFNSEESAILIAAVETYDERPRNQLRYEVQHRISSAVLNKLEHLTVLTVFDKQEYTVMLLALDHIRRISEGAKQPVAPELHVLYGRLLTLAAPDRR